MFACKKCDTTFTMKNSLQRHVKTHDGSKFSCNACSAKFTRKDNLIRHEQEKHRFESFTSIRERAIIPCKNIENLVSENFSTTEHFYDNNVPFNYMKPSVSKRSRHIENSNKAVKEKKARLDFVKTTNFVEISSSHSRKIVWYYKKNIENVFNYRTFLNSIKTELIHLLRSIVVNHPIKYNLKLEATYNIPSNENSLENRAFKTSAKEMYVDTDIESRIESDFNTLIEEEDIYTGKGSGFTIQSIDGILLGVYKYTPMSGSSYIPLPQHIASKKAIINPQNTDRQCFKWAILAKHVTGDHKYRIGKNYTIHENKYNFSGLTFPTPLNEIKAFEKNNPNVSINIYALEKVFQPPLKLPTYKVYPLKVLDHEKPEHFDLLVLNEDDKNYHYTYINKFSRLVRSQFTSHKEHVFICKRCFTTFNNITKKNKLSGQEALDEHKKICGTHKPILPVMPKEGTILKFEAWSKIQRHPIVIYADFEALLEKIDENKGVNTVAFQSHKPMSYGLLVKAADDIPQELLERFEIPTTPIIYRGSEVEDTVAKHFVETIVGIAHKIEMLLKTNMPIIMTDSEKKTHNEKTTCNLCNIIFTTKNHKVADHNHLSGRFRQTLCNTCNLKLQKPNFVPCFFHNLSHYDSHIIVRELGYDKKPITVVPNSEENFISFSKYISNDFTVRFIDTYRFMASSLSTLAANLLTPNFERFRETSKVFQAVDLELVTRKGVYPYEYTDSWDKLEEQELPSKDKFYSTLSESHITEEDYKYATKVWDHFKCNTLGEYSDLYLKIDVLLLADIFENFRNICFKTYNLDPSLYYSVAGYSFDACLKYTNIKLELLSDYDMLLMIESGIRGGLTQASMRYGKANNIKTPGYDPTQPKSWIIYQDCNNLYGKSMMEFLPYGAFKWVEPTIDGLNDLNDTSPIGRVYEVDILYPQHLHDKHNDLPFLPQNSVPPGSKVRKLMATLESKTKYVVHYRALQQALANGLIVEKVHRVVEFNQSPWLSEYINLNTEMRKKAANDFEKDFYKLMNNAVFGKTMESMRKRVKMELVSCSRRMQKLLNRPSFKHCTEYNKNLAAVTLDNKIINFIKPIYIGFTILDISKTLMYDYHYNVMKSHYNDNITLMYTDTDSLVYHVKTENFYHDLANSSDLLNRMDTANLPQDHPCYTAERKKVPGFFSDETDGKAINEFVALRAKSYAYSIEGKENIKAKGIRGHVVKNHMTLEDHKKCLFGEAGFDSRRINHSIRSYNHRIYTIKSNKRAFNNCDDKRFALDHVHSLAHGHYKINELMNSPSETDETNDLF